MFWLTFRVATILKLLAFACNYAGFFGWAAAQGLNVYAIPSMFANVDWVLTSSTLLSLVHPTVNRYPFSPLYDQTSVLSQRYV